MGRETTCLVRIDALEAHAKVLLETEILIVRSPFRVTLPFSSFTRVEIQDDALSISTVDHELTLYVRDDAKAWQKRILNPPTIWDKLGIKAGTPVRIAGRLDPLFVANMIAFGAVVTDNAPFTLLAVESTGDLQEIRSHVDAAPLWVIHRKSAVKDTEVLVAGRAAGMVDSKTARVSAERTATRFTRRHS